ncbi:MAG: hypothetical protein OCU12_07805 [Methanophagales archaeon]|nr:hypothetical protein [Methanophagales archaeon]
MARKDGFGKRMPDRTWPDGRGQAQDKTPAPRVSAVQIVRDWIGVGDEAGPHLSITPDGCLVIADGETSKIELQCDGDVLFGTDTRTAAGTNFAVLANAQTYNGEALGAGDMLLGDNSAGQPNILWDKAAGVLRFRNGVNSEATIDSNGRLVATSARISGRIEVGAGTVGTDFTGVVLDSDGLAYDGETWNFLALDNESLQAGIRSSDAVLMAGAGAVWLDYDGLNILAAPGSNPPGGSDWSRAVSFLDTAGSGDVWGAVYTVGAGGLPATGSQLVHKVVSPDGLKETILQLDAHNSGTRSASVDADFSANGDVSYTGILMSKKNGSEYSVHGYHPLAAPVQMIGNGTLSSGAYYLLTNYGIPAGTKAIYVRFAGSAGAANKRIASGPSGTYWYQVVGRSAVGVKADSSGVVNVVNDQVFVYVDATFTSIYYQIFGYWI